MGGASSQSTSARVQGSLHLRSLWRAETRILRSIRSLVGGLEIAGLAFIVGVVTSEEIPRHGLIFRGSGRVCGDGIVVSRSLVITSLDQESLVASQSETSSQGTATSSGTDNDILITREVSGGLRQTNRDGSKPNKARKDHDGWWLIILRITRVNMAFIATSPCYLDRCIMKRIPRLTHLKDRTPRDRQELIFFFFLFGPVKGPSYYAKLSVPISTECRFILFWGKWTQLAAVSY